MCEETIQLIEATHKKVADLGEESDRLLSSLPELERRHARYEAIIKGIQGEEDTDKEDDSEKDD